MAEIVFIGDWDNTNDLQLLSDGAAISTDSVTRIDANINGADVTSTNQSSDLLQWGGVNYLTGEVRCKLGAVTGLAPGPSDMYLIVYDPTNPNGVVFGPVRLTIIDLP